MQNRKAFYKVVLVGDIAVGKTTTISRWVGNLLPAPYKRTEGASDFHKSLIINDMEITLQLWDTPGLEKNATKWDGYHGADAFILLYDLTSPQTLNNLIYYIKKIKHHISQEICRRNGLILLVGNKMDKKNSIDILAIRQMQEYIKKELGLEQLPSHKRISAVSMKGVNELLTELTNQLICRFPSLLDSETTVSSDNEDTSANNLKANIDNIVKMVVAICISIIAISLLFVFWTSFIALPVLASIGIVGGIIGAIAMAWMGAGWLVKYVDIAVNNPESVWYNSTASCFVNLGVNKVLFPKATTTPQIETKAEKEQVEKEKVKDDHIRIIAPQILLSCLNEEVTNVQASLFNKFS